MRQPPTAADEAGCDTTTATATAAAPSSHTSGKIRGDGGALLFKKITCEQLLHAIRKLQFFIFILILIFFTHQNHHDHVYT